ncbi:hypothetical protein DFJ73DRAFT_877279, partial [Zopfochytrium polystomum]
MMTSFSTLALLLCKHLLPLLSCQAATTLISTASLQPPPTARLLPPFSAALALSSGVRDRTVCLDRLYQIVWHPEAARAPPAGSRDRRTFRKVP